VAAWEEWGGNGQAFGCAGAGEWRLKVADAEGRIEVNACIILVASSR
jgi:dimethylaniline monooxygenase (N-oxide forming)